MAEQQQQWVTDYLNAYRAVNGKCAQLVPSEGGFKVVADDGSSTGCVYSEARFPQLTKRLCERAAQSAA